MNDRIGSMLRRHTMATHKHNNQQRHRSHGGGSTPAFESPSRAETFVQDSGRKGGKRFNKVACAHSTIGTTSLCDSVRCVLSQEATITGLTEEVMSSMWSPSPMLSMCFQLDVDLSAAGVTAYFHAHSLSLSGLIS